MKKIARLSILTLLLLVLGAGVSESSEKASGVNLIVLQHRYLYRLNEFGVDIPVSDPSFNIHPQSGIPYASIGAWSITADAETLIVRELALPNWEKQSEKAGFKWALLSMLTSLKYDALSDVAAKTLGTNWAKEADDLLADLGKTTKSNPLLWGDYSLYFAHSEEWESSRLVAALNPSDN